MDKELEKRTYLIRKELDSQVRSFVYSAEVETGYRKFFKYTTTDQRLLAFALDNICMVSDCYILYAIAHMGVCSKESISLFLKALSKTYPDLNIVYEKTKDVLEERLHRLVKMGYVFCFRYDVENRIEDESVVNTVSLYTLVDSGYDVVKQRLQKRINVNSAIQYKPMSELIGWASATYVGSCIASSSAGFVDYLERVLRTKQLGSVYLPMELKTNVEDVNYYIAVVSSYLYRVKNMQTPLDYAETCAFKINTIKNYLYCRTKKGVAIVVISVADNDDLLNIADLIYETDILNDYLGQIYFTGEGILRGCGGDVSKSFLRMYLDNSQDCGYGFVYTAPVFI